MNFHSPVEIRGEVLRDVFAFAVSQSVPVALVVVRNEDELADSARAALDELREFLVVRQEASSWPGTELLGHTAAVFRYRFSGEVAEILARVADGLFDWVEPALPEDPCLLRADRTPWLTTVAHERDAYFTLAPEERDELLTAVPALAPLSRSPGR